MLIMGLVGAGDPAGAEAMLEGFRAVATNRRESVADLKSAEGFVALARGRSADAIDRLRSAARGWGCLICNQVQIGQAFEQMGQKDSALAAYERYAVYQIYWAIGQEVELAPTYVRLGELYEERGDRRRALEYYGKFVDMWKKADPELQPRVAEVRQRIAELTRQEN
jgi:tetratricopeptide (TPR) repeat protein